MLKDWLLGKVSSRALDSSTKEVDKFVPFDPAKFITGEVSGTPEYSVRFHLTRSTDYGDRFRLYRVFTPNLIDTNPEARYGLTMAPAGEGRFEVTNLMPQGLAEQAGIEIGDYLTEFDEERVGQPPKELSLIHISEPTRPY